MQCDDAQNLLNARADGELGADDEQALNAHLAECAQCQSAAEALKVVDTDLRRAFAPRRDAATRLAENTLATVRAAGTESASLAPPVSLEPRSSEPRFAWSQLLVGLAAGFLLAVVLFRPWESRSEGPDLVTPTAPVAQ